MEQGILMLLGLSKIMQKPDSVLPFHTALDLHDLQFGGSFPVQEPVSAEGTVRNTAGVLVLEAVISTNLHAVCDRCAAPFERRVSWPVHAVLTRSLEREDEADEWTFLLQEGDMADLDEILTTAFVLNMDSKLLCRPDCKGICPRCGKNLNEGACSVSYTHLDVYKRQDSWRTRAESGSGSLQSRLRGRSLPCRPQAAGA